MGKLRVLLFAAVCAVLLCSCVEEKPVDEFPPGYAEWEEAKLLETLTDDSISEEDLAVPDGITVQDNGEIHLPRVP